MMPDTLRLLLLLLPFLAVAGCDGNVPGRITGNPEEVGGVAAIAGTPAAPEVYTEFDSIRSLFAQKNDTTYLINFWASWCKPCLEELPLLLRLAAKQADAPLRIVLVSLDNKPDDVARVPEFLARAGITELPTLILSTEGSPWGRQLDREWTGALPTTIVYRNDLRYVYRRAFTTLPDLEAAVTPLLQL